MKESENAKMVEKERVKREKKEETKKAEEKKAEEEVPMVESVDEAKNSIPPELLSEFGEMGEEFIREQLEMMKRIEEQKKQEKVDLALAMNMQKGTVANELVDMYPPVFGEYSRGHKANPRERKFSRREKKERKLVTRRVYHSQLQVKWMKFISEFRAENLKCG